MIAFTSAAVIIWQSTNRATSNVARPHAQSTVEHDDWKVHGKRLATSATDDNSGVIPEPCGYRPLRDDRVLQFWNAANGALIALADIDIARFSPGSRRLALRRTGRTHATIYRAS